MSRLCFLRKRPNLYASVLLNPFLKRTFSTSQITRAKQHEADIAVVGGGAGGLSVATQLLEAEKDLKIVIIEPSSQHYYQPGWTFVGSGIFTKDQTVRPEASFIPPSTTWIKDKVTEFVPEENKISLSLGDYVRYKYLVVAAGIQINWDGVKGLKESIGKNGVCSNYGFDYCESTWEFIKETKSGSALFTQPVTPIKCGGAPQKIMYLADDYWTKQGVRKNIDIRFLTGTPSQFAAPDYAKELVKICDEKNINRNYKHNLIQIKPDQKIAVFKNLDTNEDVSFEYSFIHVVPPMSSPDFIKNSPIANQAGWVDVNKETLQHVKYSNIFSLGDCSSLPTSKTAAAVSSQAPILTANLLRDMKQLQPKYKYDGYTSCPIPTSYDKLMFCEFDYTLARKESTPFDQRKPRKIFFWMKQYLVPVIYWKGLLKGIWKGVRRPIEFKAEKPSS